MIQRGRTVSRQTKKQTTRATTYFPKREPSPEIAGAFDKVPHVGALHKMRKMGFTGLALSWIDDYLSTRHLQVTVGGRCSLLFPAGAVVSQVAGTYSWRYAFPDKCE